MNWKSQGNKLSGVISTGRGEKKVVSKCFCLKRTTDFPSPHISSVWMLCCCTQLEKEALRNDFITDLSFLISDWKLYCVTRFMANSIPCQRGSRSAVRAWTCSSCWVTALLGSQAPLPRHASGVWPHTQHQRARLTRLLQPALLSGVARGVFQHPSRPRTRQTMAQEITANEEPPDSPSAPQAPATGAAAASWPTEG